MSRDNLGKCCVVLMTWERIIAVCTKVVASSVRPSVTACVSTMPPRVATKWTVGGFRALSYMTTSSTISTASSFTTKTTTITTNMYVHSLL